MRIENGLGGGASRNPAILPNVRILPFAPGSHGKEPSKDTLTDSQELPETTQTDSTPLPLDIMKTIHSKINPT